MSKELEALKKIEETLVDIYVFNNIKHDDCPNIVDYARKTFHIDIIETTLNRLEKIDEWKTSYQIPNDEELENYLNDVSPYGYAIHISDLNTFDKPKELSEFKSYKKNIVNTKINGMVFETELDNSLIKAPQNFCYVEIPDDN